MSSLLDQNGKALAIHRSSDLSLDTVLTPRLLAWYDADILATRIWAENQNEKGNLSLLPSEIITRILFWLQEYFFVEQCQR